MSCVLSPGRRFRKACRHWNDSVSYILDFFFIFFSRLRTSLYEIKENFIIFYINTWKLNCKYIFCRFTSTPDKESNKYYLGPAPLEDMARWVYDFLYLHSLSAYILLSWCLILLYVLIRQIATAYGPCGNNRDYIFSLEKALFDIGKHAYWLLEMKSF